MDSSTRSVPCGFQQITDLSAPVGLTVPDTNPKATCALIIPAGQPVLFRDDGVDPTDAIGMLLPVGIEFVYNGDLSAIRFIESTSGGILNVSFYANAG